MNAQDSTQAPVRRWRELLASERDAASLYSRLAEAETGERQQIFRDLAAISSLLAFAIGAFVVVVPYLIGGGTAALVTAIGLALAAMFGVGAIIGALNGRSAVRMGLRQMFVGALAAAVTYGVGHLIGTNAS